MTASRTDLTSLPRYGLMFALFGTFACGPPGFEPIPDVASDSETSTGTGTTGVTTSTSETTDSDDTSEGSLTFFVPEADFIDTGHQCDPYAQDCPDGEKCVAYVSTGGYWNANKCVLIGGSQTAGGACSYGGMAEASDDCDADSACWDVHEVDGEWSGTCRSFCGGTGDAPTCSPGNSCLVQGEGTVTMCVASCDPLAQDCDEGLGCYWADTDFMCALSMGDLPTAAPCGYFNDCAPGHVCADTEFLPSCAGASCCTPFCDLSAPDCESFPGTTCVPFFDEGIGPPINEDRGVCISP